MNGAIGMSDIEGKAATGSGERRGSGASFNTDSGFVKTNQSSFFPCFIRVNPWPNK